ncbi:hypothetical protein [Flavobacterium sp.]|uniref:hypothetical protein n=1 Tax=Flavobacterium sp. TaxID=239 RepID=UPI0039E38C7E
MRKLILCAALIGMFTACSKDDDNNNDVPFYQAPTGVANVTLTTTGGTEFKLNGPCGWAYAAGVGYVGANQEGDVLKTFSVDTNLTALPASTTTYTITDDATDEDPTKITMHFTKMNSNGTYTSFDGYVGSGELTLVVSGNEVTADLSGILLEADAANAAPLNQNGTLSGTLKFYK